jgi:hypothetical protein
MAQNIGSTGHPYNQFQIPSLTDDANIQVALRLYHYGSETSTETPSENSVSGQLLSLAAGSIDPSDLGTEDLNTIIASGFYHQASSSNATLENSYPVEELAGLLRVTASGNNVYQQYHTLTTNQFFVRTSQNAGSTWFDWKEAGSADFVGNLMLGGM